MKLIRKNLFNPTKIAPDADSNKHKTIKADDTEENNREIYNGNWNLYTEKKAWSDSCIWLREWVRFSDIHKKYYISKFMKFEISDFWTLGFFPL